MKNYQGPSQGLGKESEQIRGLEAKLHRLPKKSTSTYHS